MHRMTLIAAVQIDSIVSQTRQLLLQLMMRRNFCVCGRFPEAFAIALLVDPRIVMERKLTVHQVLSAGIRVIAGVTVVTVVTAAIECRPFLVRAVPAPFWSPLSMMSLRLLRLCWSPASRPRVGVGFDGENMLRALRADGADK